MHPDIIENYGNKIRVRVCGLCWKGDRLLMVNHAGLGDHDFWSPPGGGVEFGQTAEESLSREFREETSLTILPKRFLFTCEFINKPLHAIELFFEVDYRGGSIQTGHDPEMSDAGQIIKEVEWMSLEAIKALPKLHRHGVFNLCNNPQSLMGLTGYLKI